MNSKAVLFLVSGLLSTQALHAKVALKYSSGMPVRQAALINEDVSRLSRFQPYKDAEMSTVMELPSPITGAVLENWLGSRVQYVVDENLSIEKKLVMIKKSHKYENPGVIPDAFADMDSAEADPVEKPEKSEKKVMVVMTNMGTAVYIVGKKAGMLLGVDVPGLGKIPMTSPRTGFLQVGEGLFANRSKEDAKLPANDLGKSYARLGTMFHEARHSDGAGKNIGFAHDSCTEGIYKGYKACDRSLNGSYAIGAYSTRALAENCKECTAAQKESLRLDYLDSFSRLVKEWKASPDPKEEELREACESLKKDGIKAPECELLDQHTIAFKAAMKDARPEGKR